MFLALLCSCGYKTCGWQVTLRDPIKHGQCRSATEMKFHVAALYKHTDGWHRFVWNADIPIQGGSYIQATNGTDEFSSGYYMWPLSTVGNSKATSQAVGRPSYSSSRALELTGFYYKRQSSKYTCQQIAPSCCSGEARTADFQSSSVCTNELSSADWVRRWLWTNNKAFEEITCQSSNHFSITLW